MQGFFRKRLLRQRVIALAAAYAIVLAGLLANLTGARMAAAAAAQPGDAIIICHTDLAGAPAPDSGNTDHSCADDCCTGCLMLSAALPQPPATATAPVFSASRRIAPLAAAVFVLRPQIESHRSRAPPLTA